MRASPVSISGFVGMQGNVQQASLGIAALSTLPSGEDLIKQVLAAQTNPQNLGKALSGAAGQGKANTGNLANALNQVGLLSRTKIPHYPASMHVYTQPLRILNTHTTLIFPQSMVIFLPLAMPVTIFKGWHAAPTYTTSARFCSPGTSEQEREACS